MVTDRIIDAVAVAGTPDEAVPRFRELTELGIDGFVLVTTTAQPIASFEAFAAEVMPHVAQPAGA